MQFVKFKNELGELIDFDAFNSPFILRSIDGTGNIKANHRTNVIPLKNGAQRTKSNMQPRYLTLNGTIVTCSRGGLAKLKTDLARVFDPLLDSGTLYYDAGDGEKMIHVIAEESPIYSNYNGNNVDFIIYLVAYNPYWHDVQINEHIFTTPFHALFNFSTAFKKPTFEMGYHTDTQSIENVGHVETPLILEFEGGVKDIKLVNTTTNEWIEVKHYIPSTDALIINSNTGEKEIALINDKGEKTNAFGLITFECSNYMHLAKGLNNIQFIAKPDATKAIVKMKWKTNYVGV